MPKILPVEGSNWSKLDDAKEGTASYGIVDYKYPDGDYLFDAYLHQAGIKAKGKILSKMGHVSTVIRQITFAENDEEKVQKLLGDMLRDVAGKLPDGAYAKTVKEFEKLREERKQEGHW